MLTKRTESMLTTIDNPHDPFTDFDAWYVYDLSSGYHTPSLLARVVNLSDDLSLPDQRQAIEDAIDEIVRENASGIHKKVTREYEENDEEVVEEFIVEGL